MLEKFKAQLLLLSALPAIIITLGLIIYMNYSRLQDFNHYLQQRGENSSSQVAALSRIALQQGNTQALQSLASNTLEENGVRSVNIYAANGHVLAHAGPKTYQEKILKNTLLQITEQQSFHYEKSILFVSAMNSGIYTSDWQDDALADTDHQNLGWVSIEYNRDRFTLNRYNSLLSQNSVFIFCLLFAAACGFYIQRRFNKDLHQINNTLKQLSDGKNVNQIAHCQNNELQDLSIGIHKLNTLYQSELSELKHSMDLTTSDLKETIETIEIQNIELGLAQKQALQASKVKSEFLANTSHEIRTPLNGIIGFAKILKRTALSIQQQEYLDTILLSSDGLLTIINDILDFSKIEAGKLELESAPCHLRQVFEEVVSLFAPLAYEKKLDINLLFYQDTPSHLHLDSARLKQILSNIISNAIKFTHQGEVVIRVTLESENSSENKVSIKTTVSDTGIGMTALQQKGLFQAFTQSNTSISREYGGTGLGLAISKKLIEKFDGDITVESALEKGTTFHFNFWAEKQSQTQSTEDAPFAGKSVALISYNKHTGLTIENLLKQWGVKIFTLELTQDLEQQLEKLNTHYHIDSMIYAPDFNYNTKIHSHEYQLLASKYHLKLIALTATPGFYHESMLNEKMTTGYQPVTETSFYRTLVTHFGRINNNIKTQQHSESVPIFLDLHILAVDDNHANLKLLTILLTDLGAKVTPASDGEQAIQASQKQRFDVIFMDLQMPIINGFEASKHIRQQQQTPIIALTAHALADEKQRLLDIGVNAYLSKPINEAMLIEEVSKVCQLQLRQKTITDRSSHTLKAVNLNHCLSLANYKIDLATDMFLMLVSELDKDMQQIDCYFTQKDMPTLLEEIHKLNGACSYTGVPKLKQACMAIETNVKELLSNEFNNDASLAVLMIELKKEVDAVLTWHKMHNISEQLNLQQ